MDAISSLVLQDGWRKGPWTALEDRLLTEYVQKHGEGSWNSVAKLTGLRRSGKSCRLRWVNYLRPDLKRGKITPDEETVILQLHALLGNRWSAIARCLPGRTDNEIKNYWRTHFKKSRPSRRARAQLLQQYQQQQQQYLQSLQLQHQQQMELELEQQHGLQEAHHVMMAQAMNQEKGWCCHEPPPAAVVMPEHYVLPGDVACDDALWESLWRLVDANGGVGGEGASGGDY